MCQLAKQSYDGSFFVSLRHDTQIGLMDESDMPFSCQSAMHSGGPYMSQLDFCPYDAADVVLVYLARVDLPSRHYAPLRTFLL